MIRGKHFTIFKGGYKIDRRIFSVAFLLIFVFWLLVVIDNGASLRTNFYLSCKYSTPCENPIYNNLDALKFLPVNYHYLINMSLLPAHFFAGKAPSLLFGLFNAFVLFDLFLAFLFNHFLHNKGFDFRKNRLDAWEEEDE